MKIDKKNLNHFQNLVNDLAIYSWDDDLENIVNPFLKIYLQKHPILFSSESWYSLDQGLFMCQSPIEQMMLMGLAHSVQHHIPSFQVINDQQKWDEYITAKTTNDLIVYPQAKIGKYRVDFRIKYLEHLGMLRSGNEEKDFVKEILVECDGHDFHEKTKEQAQKDKKRDRDLNSLGFSVLRFTGSEIWKNPFDCANEILSCLTQRRTICPKS